MTPRAGRGFTLLEVLITLLVFSFGLLIVAGLQAVSKKANYDALQRTTASLLAHDVIERMRANDGELEEYVLDAGETLGAGEYAAPANDCQTTDCNAVQLAWRDLYEWERALIGASELVDDQFTGGLVDPTACIDGPSGSSGGVYTIAIAWRGVTELSNPGLHACGEDSGLYGDDDEYRRLLVISTYITPS